MSVSRRHLTGPTLRPLAPGEQVDWHDHAVHQLVYPSHGILHVSTSSGSWVVPSLRAVWLPAGVAHAHRAHGPTQMRTLSFPARANPLNVARPVVVAVSPLLREVIIAVTDTSAATSPAMSAPARRRLEEVALDQLRVIDTLPLWLPEPTDSRLRHLADILRADPADGRTLTELGVVVGAGARTLSRLFNQQTGMSFPQWRAQLRLHHSLLLLAEGHPVTATALACGYENPSAFIESFRHSFGITPGAHQRQTLRAADIPEARLRD